MPIGPPLALLVLCAFAAAAQRVDLYGRVLDTSEGGIGQADVTAVNEDTGFRRMTQSDPGGGTEVGVSGHRLVHVLGVRLDHASTGHDERKLDQQGQDDDGETADA